MMLVASVLFIPAAAPKNPNTSAEVVFADESGSGAPYRLRSDEGVVENPTDGAYLDTRNACRPGTRPRAISSCGP